MTLRPTLGRGLGQASMALKDFLVTCRVFLLVGRTFYVFHTEMCRGTNVSGAWRCEDRFVLPCVRVALSFELENPQEALEPPVPLRARLSRAELPAQGLLICLAGGAVQGDKWLDLSWAC